MANPIKLVCLDVGEKRIGVAVGDSAIRIAVPYETIDVDGSEIDEISKILESEKANILVIGYPRNQAGEPTKQTQFVEEFVKKLHPDNAQIVFQDESMTSVLAESRLESYKKPYNKADIDAQAAAIILQDYIELNYGK